MSFIVEITVVQNHGYVYMYKNGQEFQYISLNSKCTKYNVSAKTCTIFFLYTYNLNMEEFEYVNVVIVKIYS